MLRHMIGGTKSVEVLDEKAMIMMNGSGEGMKGRDDPFTDAWRMQATIEESMPDLQMQNLNGNSNPNVNANLNSNGTSGDAFAYPNLF